MFHNRQCMIISGELQEIEIVQLVTCLYRPIYELNQLLLHVGMQNFQIVVCAPIIIQIKLFHSHADVEIDPLLQKERFIFEDSADDKDVFFMRSQLSEQKEEQAKE